MMCWEQGDELLIRGQLLSDGSHVVRQVVL